MIELKTEPTDSNRTSEAMSSLPHPRPGNEVTSIEVLTELALRKWLIFRVTGIAVLTGLILAFILPVRYTATTRLMPPQQVQTSATMLMNQLTNTTGGSSLAALTGGGLGLKNPNDIYVGLLTSRPISDAIIEKFGLLQVYHAKDMTAARKCLASNTVVVSEKSGFIAISVTDRDRQRAPSMANAYIDQLRFLTKTLAVTEASQRRLFYEDQLRQTKDALVNAELEFQRVQQNRGLVQLDAQAKAMIESLAALRAQVAAQQVQVEALRSYSTERNPELELAERQLASFQAEEARLEERNRSSGFGHFGLGDVPGAGLEYLRADHEVRYRQALFDLLLKQYDAAKLDESKDAAIIQVVEPAIPPDQKSAPKRTLIVLLSTICGFLCSCFMALIFWWKELIYSEPQLSSQFQKLKGALSLKREAMRETG